MIKKRLNSGFSFFSHFFDKIEMNLNAGIFSNFLTDIISAEKIYDINKTLRPKKKPGKPQPGFLFFSLDSY